MKPCKLYIPFAVAAIAASAFFMASRSDNDVSEPENTVDVPVPVSERPAEKQPPEPAPAPSVQSRVALPKPVHKPAPVQRKIAKPTEEQQRAAILRMWKRAEEQFGKQMDQLSRTQDPQLRSRLINRMAQYVRMNTLDAIEWAMGLEDPEERRLALEAINKYALSGIGARISVDQTGFPRIQDTTALSAVASTGMIQTGDYIVGMVNAEGQMIDFENMPVQQIVQHLRGEPGSELLLLMERGADGYPFDVPLQRSLLVIQPPF